MLAATWAASMGMAQQPFDLDLGFRTNILTSGVFTSQYVNSIHVLDDGKLYVSGQFHFAGDATMAYFKRLNSDGQLDVTFPNVGAGTGKITPWSNGYYVGTGQEIKRLTSNATLDPTFDMNSSWPLVSIFQGGDYHVYPDGRVLVTGSHDMEDTARGFVGPHQLVWFQSNGYLDTTQVHRKANGILWTLREQPDDKFLVSCTCTYYDDQPVSPIFRIHPDGSLDTSFHVALEPWGYTYEMLTMPDGRILVAGNHQVSWSTDTLCAFRFMPNGDLDPTFVPVPCQLLYSQTQRANAYGLLALDDGRHVLTGNFDQIHGQPRGGIALLNEDGSLSDEHFVGAACGEYASPGGPRRVIAGIVPASDGSYYIHGVYHGYSDGTTNDPTQRFVSRLYGLDVGVRELEQLRMEVYPNPASTYVVVELQEPLAHGVLVLRDALGRAVLQQRVVGYYNTMNTNGLGNGVYLIELWSNGERRATRKLVVQQ